MRTDRTDIVNTVSVLSVPTQRDFWKKYGIYSQKTPINRTDRTDIVDQYEERVAIAGYDGEQNTIQAHRIAYEGAIMTTLFKLHLDTAMNSPDKELRRKCKNFLLTKVAHNPNKKNHYIKLQLPPMNTMEDIKENEKMIMNNILDANISLEEGNKLFSMIDQYRKNYRE